MSEIGAAYVTILPSAKGFGRALDGQVSGQAEASGKKAGLGWGKAFGIAAAAGLGLKTISFFSDSISAASDLNESINAVTVAYGKQAGAVQKLSEAAPKNLALTRNEFNELAVRFSNFAETVGGGGKASVGVLDDLTTRAADFASVFNVEVAEAATLFQSGLAGETEPLRRFGIDMSAAAVEAFAYANGIAETGSKLTEAQKVQSRYALLMQATAKTQGDLANTSGGLANQQRFLGTAFTELKANVGESLLPVLTSFVTFLNSTALPAVTGFIDDMQAGVGVGGAFGDVLGFLGDHLGVVAAVLGSSIALWAGYKVAMIAAKAVQVAVAAATKAYAAAQWLLNAALTANPIGLVIAGLAAIAAGLVIAYKKSETFRNIVDGVWSWIKSHWPLLVAILTGPIGIAVGLIIKHWDKVVDTVKAIPGIIKGVFSGAGTLLVQVGKDVVNGLIAGIKAMAGAAADAAIGVVKGALDKAKSFLRIGSPSKVWEEVGVWSMRGLADGITKGGKKVQEALKKQLDALKSKLSGLKSDMASLSESVASAFTSDVFGGNLRDLLGGLGQDVFNLTAVRGALDTLRTMGASKEFLSALFQSGNTDLILSLASSPGSLEAAQRNFALRQSLAAELGAEVGWNEFGNRIDKVKDEIAKLRQDVQQQGRQFAAGLNSVAGDAARTRGGRPLVVA